LSQVFIIIIIIIIIIIMDNLLLIATRYGLDGPGIEFRWGARFFAPVRTDRAAHPASYAKVTGSFPGVKRPERDVDHTPHLATKLKKEQSCFLLPSRPSCPVLGWSLLLLVFIIIIITIIIM